MTKRNAGDAMPPQMAMTPKRAKQKRLTLEPRQGTENNIIRVLPACGPIGRDIDCMLISNNHADGVFQHARTMRSNNLACVKGHEHILCADVDGIPFAPSEATSRSLFANVAVSASCGIPRAPCPSLSVHYSCPGAVSASRRK